jgi:hypothetical protein
MAKVISIHEYVLKPGADEKAFEKAIRAAQRRGLLQLPGLKKFYFVKGIRGVRKGRFAAIWVYQSRRAWESLWGPPGKPVSKKDYPHNWKAWEEEVLAPFLQGDPDAIRFTAYQEVDSKI